eukprot:TRINITY_DN21107_c0_g1::TRINITY_DN21107_c0_g1_i1::g.23378::m.23378 TRINITY_DN21107_c0_g1::TRINITY_DN21107_c0_g1_i1::g.23378  ORF type:complete len:138 (-),score=4.29 TRINITY_DN21107_c0_g1_i1:3-416(-)
MQRTGILRLCRQYANNSNVREIQSCWQFGKAGARLPARRNLYEDDPRFVNRDAIDPMEKIKKLPYLATYYLAMTDKSPVRPVMVAGEVPTFNRYRQNYRYGYAVIPGRAWQAPGFRRAGAAPTNPNTNTNTKNKPKF